MSDELPMPRFKDLIYGYVAEIPYGRIMTYGQLAALAGHPRGARLVGGIAHYGPTDLPWHRVVNRHGGTATGYHGGRSEQSRELMAEGIEIVDDRVVRLDELLWYPHH